MSKRDTISYPMGTMLVRGSHVAHAKTISSILGRELLVSNAIGTTSFGGIIYSTTAQNITGLLPVGSVG